MGSRVVVPLGKRKQYTAIVVRCPGTPAAAGIQIKEILEVVDEAPLLLPAQLEMWRWMAHYYMCTPGEVMKAALPSGLKLESEAFVVLPKDRVADDEADETDDEEGVANNPAHPPAPSSSVPPVPLPLLECGHSVRCAGSRPSQSVSSPLPSVVQSGAGSQAGNVVPFRCRGIFQRGAHAFPSWPQIPG